MHVGKTIQQEYAYKLKIDNTAYELGEIEEQKDIGVIIYSNLEFDKHFNQKINKAIMAVIRSFTTLNQHNCVPLYKALVMSHLDYAISIWSSCKQKYQYGPLINRDAETCNKAASWYEGYSLRGKTWNFPHLYRGDMIEVYKLLQGKYDSDVSNIVNLHKDSDTREGTKGQ